MGESDERQGGGTGRKCEPKPLATPASGGLSVPTYMLQYSHATQMILNRLKAQKNESQGHVDQLSPPSRPPTASPDAIAEARKRLLQTMKTSATMAMPPQPAAPRRRSVVSAAAVPVLSLPKATTNSVPRPHAPKAASPAGNTLPLPTPVYPPVQKLDVLRPKPSGHKVIKPRIRPVSRDGGSDLEEDEDEEGEMGPKSQTTKSRRQIHRPAHFVPSPNHHYHHHHHHHYHRRRHKHTAMAAAAVMKKKAVSRRTESQSMCLLCQRLAFTDDNRVVLCDSCNDAWHQKCANPVIPAHVTASDIPWFCLRCQALKVPFIGSGDGLVGWEHKTKEQKMAYLSTVPQPMLLTLLGKILETNQNLPIFPPFEGENISPASSTSSHHHHDGRSLNKGQNPVPFLPPGVLTAAGKKNGKNGGGGHHHHHHDPQQQQQQHAVTSAVVDVHELNLMDLEGGLRWPRHGGLYAELPPEKDDPMMEDGDDYEAFSIVRYDRQGKKTWENGRVVERGPGRRKGRR